MNTDAWKELANAGVGDAWYNAELSIIRNNHERN